MIKNLITFDFKSQSNPPTWTILGSKFTQKKNKLFHIFYQNYDSIECWQKAGWDFVRKHSWCRLMWAWHHFVQRGRQSWHKSKTPYRSFNNCLLCMFYFPSFYAKVACTILNHSHTSWITASPPSRINSATVSLFKLNPLWRKEKKDCLYWFSLYRETAAALQHSSEISQVDSTERICYQGRCYALTLRIIISISTLPNIPKWAWRRTKPAPSLCAQVTGGWWCTCHWGANDPLPRPSSEHTNRIHTEIWISAEQFRYPLIPLLDSYSWAACYSSEAGNCEDTPGAYNELS